MVEEEVEYLNSWRSDSCGNKTTTESFNIVQFYHKILWDSQHQQQSQVENCIEDTDKKSSKRHVQFSPDPPDVYEYEPEHSRGLLFSYQQYFKRKFEEHREKEYYPTHIPNISIDAEDLNQDEEIVVWKEDKALVLNKRLRKSRSLSEFRPVPNQYFNRRNTIRDGQGKLGAMISPEYNGIFDSIRIYDSSAPENLSMIFIPPVGREQGNHDTTVSPIFSKITHQPTTSTTSVRSNKDSGHPEVNDNDPPPSYIEHDVINQAGSTRSNQSPYGTFRKKLVGSLRGSKTFLMVKKKHSLVDHGDVNNSSGTSSNDNDAHHRKAFIQRTLSKFKFSPSLMIERRASVASLRKKISFLSA